MYLLLYNLCLLILVAVFSCLNFNDASVAISNGIFSNASTHNYSVSKGVFLYAVFVFSAALLSYLFLRFFPRSFDKFQIKAKQAGQIDLPKIQRKEVIFLFVMIAFLSFINIYFRQKILDYQSLYNEDLYNLAVAVNLGIKNFTVIYPYSVGNLLVISFFKNIGIGIIFYKVILNILATCLLYLSIAIFVDKIKYRILLTSGLLFIYFFNSTINPTLHVNNFRLLLPVFSLLLLFIAVNRFASSRSKKILALTGICFVELFFGSADNIAIFVIIYGVFSLVRLAVGRDIKELFVFAISSIIAFFILFILFGQEYIQLLANQIRSIYFFSGQLNASPYPDLFAIRSSVGFSNIIRDLLYTSVSYLPFIILANITFFVAILWFHKDVRKSEQFIFLALLLLTYLLNFRKALGDAGVGRVVTASIVLVFILLTTIRFYEAGLLRKIILNTGAAFFLSIVIISIYFIPYGLIDAYSRNSSNDPSLIDCSGTNINNLASFAGYVKCNKDLVQEFSEIKNKVKNNTFYVTDDTFSLYYFLNSPAVELVPSLYSEKSKQIYLTNNIRSANINYIIAPKQKHYFGIPKEYYSDPRVLSSVNLYIAEHYKRIATYPHFEFFFVK